MTGEKREQQAPPSPPIEGEITDEELDTTAGGTMDIDDFESRRSLSLRRSKASGVSGDEPAGG